MAKTNLSLPGSIYSERGRLTIKIPYPDKVDEKGYAVVYRERTGLLDNRQGRDLARERHYKLYRDIYLGEKSSQTETHYTIYSVFDMFIKSKTYQPKTIVSHSSAFRTVFDSSTALLTDENVNRLLRAYINETSKRRGHNSVTVGTYLRSVTTFINWCIKKRHLTSNALDLEDVSIPRLSQEEREDTVAGRFMPDEIERMLKSCYAHDEEYGLMNELQRETGARIVDVTTLEFSQWLGDKIRWKNKNTKEPETRVISDRAVEIMKKLRLMRPNDAKVFRWQHGSSSRLARTFNTCLASAGLPKHLDGKKRSAKSWRVVFRSTLIGLPIEVTKKLMRHKSIRTTDEHYTTFTDDEMKGYLQHAKQKQ